MLTLFSHDINTLEPVQRIFDFLLSRNPAAVIYLGVAVSMHCLQPIVMLLIRIAECL